MNYLENLIYKSKSIKYALMLMVCIVVLAVLLLYLRWQKLQYLIWWSINLSLLLLAVSLISCSMSRLRSYRKLSKVTSGHATKITEYQHSSLPALVLLEKLATQLINKGFQVNQKGEELTAIKNRSGLLGSLGFHCGLVIILLGFLINTLWGFQGSVLLPERVLLKVNESINFRSKGLFYGEVPEYYLGLDKFSYSDPTGWEKEPLIRPTAELYFRNAQSEERQRLTVNNPVQFSKIKWQYQDSGYSLFLKISNPEGVLVNDFVNIASHQGIAWSDSLAIAGGRNLEIKFYPDFQELGKNSYTSQSRFPRSPATEISVSEQGKIKGKLLLPLGQTKNIGNLTVSFSAYRYWVLLDVLADPGRPVILLGGLITVLGLAWRILFLTLAVTCQAVDDEQGGTMVSWGVRAAYSNNMFREELRTMFGRLED